MARGHYFDTDPQVGSDPGEVILDLPEGPVGLVVDRGVFSSARVDPGTVTLLRSTPAPPPNGDLLDLGCGYGPIACTLARRAPGATIWALDVNRRALELTAANASHLGLSNVAVAVPDAIDPTLRFAGIWSNPPIRIGKDALHGMLDCWIPRLLPGASAWLVVKRHLGADSLAAWMTSLGWGVQRACSKKGYRVLRVRAEATG
jgi:16S rRNA (guanine1207-N2)-methyltransferase